jgi:hypothetical protein
VSIPVGYTEDELADMMVVRLGDVGVILSWTAGSPQVQEAVTSTLVSWGGSVEVLGTTAEVRRLRAIAMVHAWRAAVESLAARYDHREGQFAYSRSQAHAMALKSLAVAESEAAAVGVLTDYAVVVESVVRTEDPYARDAGEQVGEF